VLIIDIDVHHPNGTEEIVLADPDRNLALVSIHRHMEGEELVYPGTGGGESDGDRVLNLHNGGAKITEKFITTKAWPQVEAFAAHFHPHLIVVSAGFDASRDDIMAHGSLSSSFYATLAQMIVGLAEDHCGSRVIALQEGGYLALHPDHLPAEIPQDDDRLLRPLLSNIRHFIGGLT
jgi:acetoin utilization deacetylase AcuC-like enzyme